jgi:DNA-binding NarL/FixJ family response regulator
VRVVLADDSILLREGIARLLEEAGFEVVGQAGTADELMLKVRSYSPAVALVDIRMPPTHTSEGLDAAAAIRASAPEVGLLVLSQYVDADYAFVLLRERPERSGYLIKDRIAQLATLVEAIERVAAGETVVDPDIDLRVFPGTPTGAYSHADGTHYPPSARRA